MNDRQFITHTWKWLSVFYFVLSGEVEWNPEHIEPTSVLLATVEIGFSDNFLQQNPQFYH